MGNGRLYFTLGSFLVPTRFLAPMAASEIGPQTIQYTASPEPELVNVRSPGFNSKESIPSAYVAWQAGTKTLFDVPARQAT